MNNLVKRSLIGVVYVACIFYFTTSSPIALIGFLAVLAAICYYEYVKITKFTDLFYLIGSIAVSCYIFYYYSNLFLTENSPYFFKSLRFAPPILFLIAVITILFSSNELQGEFAKATIGVVYIAAPFAIALSIPYFLFDIGNLVLSKDLLFIFILIWISDTFAYLIGSRFGKHKLAPKISEKKSWEGLIGGIIFTIIGGYIIETYFSESLRGNWIILGIIIAIVAPIGDLVESKLKREFNVKDSSGLIPGHGGFLDRLDSFMFSIIAVYTYFLIEYLLV